VHASVCYTAFQRLGCGDHDNRAIHCSGAATTSQSTLHCQKSQDLHIHPCIAGPARQLSFHNNARSCGRWRSAGVHGVQGHSAPLLLIHEHCLAMDRLVYLCFLASLAYYHFQYPYLE